MPEIAQKLQAFVYQGGVLCDSGVKSWNYTMASIKQDPFMKFLGGFITYNDKGVPKLIYKKK
jgi:hypothetical protein